MSKLIITLLISLFIAVICVNGQAPSDLVDDLINTASVDDNLLNKPLVEWQLNATTLLLVVMVVGRAVNYARRNGGLRGIWRGIWFGVVAGENSPPR